MRILNNTLQNSNGGSSTVVKKTTSPKPLQKISPVKTSINNFRELDSINKSTNKKDGEVKSLASFYENLSTTTKGKQSSQQLGSTLIKPKQPQQQQQDSSNNNNQSTPKSNAKKLSIQKERLKERQNVDNDEQQDNNITQVKPKSPAKSNDSNTNSNSNFTPKKELRLEELSSKTVSSPSQKSTLSSSSSSSNSSSTTSANEIALQIRSTVDVYRNKITQLEDKLEISTRENNTLKQQLQLLNNQYTVDTCALLDIINEHESTIIKLKQDIELSINEPAAIDVETSPSKKQQQDEIEQEDDQDEEQEEEEEEEQDNDESEQEDEEIQEEEEEEEIQDIEQETEEEMEIDQEYLEELKEELEEAYEHCYELTKENEENSELLNKYKTELTECQALIVYYKEELSKKSIDCNIFSKKLVEKNDEILKYKQRIQNFVEMMELSKELNGSVLSTPPPSGSKQSYLSPNRSLSSPMNRSVGPIVTPTKSLSSSSLLNNSINNGGEKEVFTTPQPKLKKKSITVPEPYQFRSPSVKKLNSSRSSISSNSNNSSIQPMGKSRTPKKVLCSPRSLTEYI
ncbi:hypothetical protein CYY_005062 [Polysphondylium violaceum]|uniref:Uncharacterized protein n=1 Tax=Polysphondylium violaceum TaxID=133409 RepID=A0A8J4PTL7_9MYCE|nr:hypothetical protein CYY_005062 [Polysphondylium violaceum]